MNFPKHETVEKLRSTYPVGCRIVLDHMDDPYVHIPVGAQATVTGVDDAGNLMCAWDCGSSLSLAFGADRAHKIRTEDEARVTLDHYGARQPEKNCRCPRCGEIIWGPKARHALSRYAAVTVCDRCGMEESLERAGMDEAKPLMKWCAVELPAVGGGAWRR
jgi:hypothetical protein